MSDKNKNGKKPDKSHKKSESEGSIESQLSSQTMSEDSNTDSTSNESKGTIKRQSYDVDVSNSDNLPSREFGGADRPSRPATRSPTSSNPGGSHRESGPSRNNDNDRPPKNTGGNPRRPLGEPSAGPPGGPPGGPPNDPPRGGGGGGGGGGGSGGGGGRGGSYTPPFEREHNLSEEDKLDAIQSFSPHKDLFDFEVNENVIYLTYRDLYEADANLDLHEVWKELITNYHNEQGLYEIKLRTLRDPFTDQLNHMLKLSGLQSRNWNMLIGSVIFDDSEDNIKRIEAMVYACRYQGFDPAVILKRLVKSWRDSLVAPLVSFTLAFETKEGIRQDWNYTNHEKLIEDMTFLVTVFLNRGAVVEKILKKSAKDFSSVMRMLTAKYSIRVNEEGRRRRAEAIAPEVVTLPRIAACFAQLTTSLYNRGFGRTIANFTDLQGCPTAIFSPMFPSVCRKAYSINGAKVNIHPQLILIAILVDNVLHIRDKVTPLDQIWTYYLASYNSGVLIDSARIVHCDDLGVTIGGYFREDILEKRAICCARIRDLRPHERIGDFLREMDEIP